MRLKILFILSILTLLVLGCSSDEHGEPGHDDSDGHHDDEKSTRGTETTDIGIKSQDSQTSEGTETTDIGVSLQNINEDLGEDELAGLELELDSIEW